MDAVFVRYIMLLLGIILIPVVGIILISIICAICLSAAIYANVVLTLIRDTTIFSKCRGNSSISNDIN